MSNHHLRYHPRIGYTYMPSVKVRIPWYGGFLVRTNAAGYRSDREFVPERAPGSFRVLLFGDSQTAGDGVANAQRYSDLLEKATPGLEIYNYGLSGTGSDQQFLSYQENAFVEHDLIVLTTFVRYIGRVNCRIIRFQGANGEMYFLPKPYFQIEDGELVLHNVPVVPKLPWTKETLPEEYLPYVYPPPVDSYSPGVSQKLRTRLGRIPALDPLKKAFRTVEMRLKSSRIVQDYDREDPRWLLLRKILETWIGECRTPVLLVSIPYFHKSGAPFDLNQYQARLRELAEGTGCHLYDPVPDLLKLTAEERGAFCAHDHLTARGHEAIAGLLAPIFERLMRERRALPSGNGTHDGLSPAERG